MNTRRWCYALMLLTLGCHAQPPSWAMRTTTVGPVALGASQAEVAVALGLPAAAAPTVGGCLSWKPAGLPPGLRLMIEDGRLVRADVYGGDLKTHEGAGIGSTEAQLASLYPGLVTQPHKYRSAEGWHYLIYRPTGAADSASRFVFETDGHTVQSYRSGIEPAVEYVEGCG